MQPQVFYSPADYLFAPPGGKILLRFQPIHRIRFDNFSQLGRNGH